MKKGCHRLVLLVILLSLLLLPAVFAAEESLLKAVWTNLIWIFSLGWITEATNPFTTFIAFVRFVLALITFVLVYELLTNLQALTGKAKTQLLSPRATLVISVAIALMSAVFFPEPLLLTIVVMYGTFVAFIMVFFPVLAALWLAFGGFEVHKPEDNYLYGVRIVFLVIAIWLLRILAQWTKFTVTSGSAIELQRFATASAEIPAEFGVKIVSILTTLTTMADFATFVLVIAILYNLNHWIFPTPPSTQATGAGQHILSGIGEAIRGRAEEQVEATARQIRYPSLKEVEKGFNELLGFFRNLEQSLRDTLVAQRRPANMNQAVQRILDDLRIPVTIVNRVQGTSGYEVNVDTAALPPSIRRPFVQAMRASTTGGTDAHNALRMTLDALSSELENNLQTITRGSQTERTDFHNQRVADIANCIVLIRALLARNRLQYRGR